MRRTLPPVLQDRQSSTAHRLWDSGCKVTELSTCNDAAFYLRRSNTLQTRVQFVHRAGARITRPKDNSSATTLSIEQLWWWAPSFPAGQTASSGGVVAISSHLVHRDKTKRVSKIECQLCDHSEQATARTEYVNTCYRTGYSCHMGEIHTRASRDSTLRIYPVWSLNLKMPRTQTLLSDYTNLKHSSHKVFDKTEAGDGHSFTTAVCNRCFFHIKRFAKFHFQRPYSMVTPKVNHLPCKALIVISVGGAGRTRPFRETFSSDSHTFRSGQA